jgi:hypothetical protein
VKFHSKAEAQRAGQLILLALAGDITGLVRQFPFQCHVNGILVATYHADFVYLDNRLPGAPQVVEDVKSEPTRRTDYYRLKKRLFEACWAPLTITEVAFPRRRRAG